MNCKLKQMSSYQRLKWEEEQLYADLIKAKATIARMQSALWVIAELKGPRLTEAPEIALKGLKPDETK